MNKKNFQKIFKDKIILINKEAGVTSHDEVVRLRKIVRNSRVGHSGTLDPKVTGMLVMGIGKTTKILEYMLMSEKIYIAEFLFHKSCPRTNLEQALEHFTGKITQLPPRKSAVKRVEREREVHELELLDFDPSGRRATIRCSVERGTYIRKLVHDLGEHMRIKSSMGELHRTAVGPFNEIDHKTIGIKKLARLSKIVRRLPFMAFLLKPYLYSIEDAISFLPGVVVDKGAEKPVTSGSPLYAVGVNKIIKEFERNDTVIMYKKDTKGRLSALAVGTAEMDSEESLASKEGVAIKTDKVFI